MLCYTDDELCTNLNNKSALIGSVLFYFLSFCLYRLFHLAYMLFLFCLLVCLIVGILTFLKRGNKAHLSNMNYDCLLTMECGL